jgi:hypothetical protein
MLRSSSSLDVPGRRLGPGAQVTVRINRMDPTHVHVRDVERGAWIEAKLVSPAAPDAS